MKTQFVVSEICRLPNEKLALSGSVIGPLLSAGQQGSATTPSGKVKIEVASIGIVDSTRVKPGMQALQIRMVEGDVEALRGATLTFE